MQHNKDSNFLILLIIPLVLSIGLISPLAYTDSIKSPRQQMSEGISAQNVICKGGFTLMIRMSGDAACVTPPTASKLDAVGWGEILKAFEIEPEPQDEEVALNEEVRMSDDKSSESEKESEEGKTIEVNISDGAGTSDRP